MPGAGVTLVGTKGEAMTLTDWMTKEGLSHSKAAERLGVPLWTLRGWVYDGKSPQPDTMYEIEVITRGDVSLVDWARVGSKRLRRISR